MIPELGHYALMLALGLALIQGIMPVVGTRTNDPVLMSIAAPAALAQFAFVAIAFARARRMLRRVRFLGAQRLREFQLADAADLPAHQHLGQSRRLDDAVGSILAFFGALVAAFGTNLPVTLKANALAVQAWIAAAFELFILMTSNPFVRMPTRRSRAGISIRSCRTRSRLPSADALSRLCRLLDRILLRHRRVD